MVRDAGGARREQTQRAEGGGWRWDHCRNCRGHQPAWHRAEPGHEAQHEHGLGQQEEDEDDRDVDGQPTECGLDKLQDEELAERGHDEGDVPGERVAPPDRGDQDAREYEC